MANLKRDNHYLPECYQKGFTDSSGRVWVKFANRSEPEHRNPSSVGKRRSLYIRKQDGIENDEVEDFFSRAVEAPFASLSQRIKKEQNKLSSITGEEQGILCRFIASQTVRTLAHKESIDEQAGGTVDANTFVRVMLRNIWTMLDAWIKNPPRLDFHTSLPHVGEHFITGDSPVLVIQVRDNPIWVPNDTPSLGITSLEQILLNQNHRFWVSLSPYVSVSMQSHGTGEPHLPAQTVDPRFVRQFNTLIRRQSGIFVLARDRASLT